MLIGLVLADSFTFYPTSLIKNQYISPLQSFGFLCFVLIAIHLFLEINKKRNKQNLFAIINNTEDLIWSIDTNYNYLAFNKAYEKKITDLYGHAIKTGGKVWNEKHGKEQKALWKSLFDRGLEGEKFSIDMDYSKIAGEAFYINVSFNPIYDSENQVKGVGCFLQNITQRLLHEEQINKQNQNFKEIAFIISHTVRAPLSNILGLVEVLDKENPLNEVNKQIMEHIKSSAKQLDGVVRNVVDRTTKLNTQDARNNKMPFIS
jgi:PAS domain S-box-containing protein